MTESLLHQTRSQFFQAPARSLRILLLASGVTMALGLLCAVYILFAAYLIVMLGGATSWSVLAPFAEPLGLFVIGLGGFACIGFMTAASGILWIDGRLKALQKIPVLRILALSALPALPFVFIATLAENLGQDDNPLFWLVLVLGFGILAVFLPVFMLRIMSWIWGRPEAVEPATRVSGLQLLKVNGLSLFMLLVLGFLASIMVLTLEQGVGSQLLVGLELGLVLLLMLPCLFVPVQAAVLAYAASNGPSELTLRKFPFSPALLLGAGAGLVLLIGDAVLQSRFAAREEALQPTLSAQRAQNRYQRPVLRGKALPGNGAENYWQILGKEENAQGELSFHFTRRFPELAQSLPKDKESFIEPRSGLILPTSGEKYLPVIRALQTAAAHEYIQHDYDFSSHALLPNFITSQDLSKLMVSRAMAKCQAGPASCQEGAELFLDVLRLGQDTQYRGSIIDGMVGIVIKRAATQNALPLLSHTHLEAEHYAALLSQMRILLASERNLGPALANEMLTLQSEFIKLNRKSLPEAFKTLSELGAVSDNPLAQSILALTTPVFRPQLFDAVDKLEQLRTRFAEIYRLPIHQQQSAWKQLEQEIVPLVQSNAFLAISLPNYIGIQTRETHDLTRMRAAYLYLALEAYHARNQQYPGQLTELTPGITPELPVDPWTGQAFRYKRRTSGDYLLYSLGQSGTDLGGKGFNEFDPAHKTCYTLGPKDNLLFSNRMTPKGVSEKDRCKAF